MKNYSLSIITENQSSRDKAKKLGGLISADLGTKAVVEVSKYDKFPDSFKIEIKGEIKDELKSIEESIKITDMICSPWILEYKRNEDEIALIFNKTDFSNFRRQNFNVIKWANFEID